MKSFVDRYGPWAIVTGGSYGLGAAFARELARLGFNLVLVARDEKKLQHASGALTKAHSIETRIVALDLSLENSVDVLLENVSKLDVGLVIHNAAIFPKGRFHDVSVADHLNAVRLNCTAPLHLAHKMQARLKERATSGMIFLSSVQAFQGTPFMTSYAATKAFDLILGEGLHYELKPFGIDVLSAAPGLLSRGEKSRGPGSIPMSVAAKLILAKLGKKSVYIPGLANKLFYHCGKFWPRRFRTFITARTIKKSILGPAAGRPI